MTNTTPRPGDQIQTAAELEFEWRNDPRWADVRRDYTAEDVVKLRGPVAEDRTLARRGAQKLAELIDASTGDEWVAALGALTGNQAVQQVKAGLKAIYLSGWQVAADANTSGQTYPDQSLYPVDSVPTVVRRINNALVRAAQVEAVIARGLAYAPYADLLWVESSAPDLELARRFAEAIHEQYPDQKLAYNCSPSFNWKSHLDDDQIASFQRELAGLGYAFQFITLAGFHALNHSMFELARNYSERQMSAYVELQEAEFASEPAGYTATRHQREVGTGYFDQVATVLNPESATLALVGSTETEQFH